MRDEFYVGYLPLPAGFKRFLMVLLPVLAVGALVLSVVMTSQQNDPGTGTWDLSETVTIEGTYQSSPYPMLLVADDTSQEPRQILLVTMGKIGGRGLDLPEDGGAFSVTGYPIERGDGAVLLTIETPESDIKTLTASVTEPELQALGPKTLVGQIIDPKCYFGAMKPGEGKVHKACATLCIKGGIPPMLMTTDMEGERNYYLLLDEDGGGITGKRLDALLPYVADPVKIAGEVGQIGGMLVFQIDPDKIDRL